MQTMSKIIQISDTHLYKDKNGTLKGVNTLQSFSDCISHIQKHHSDMELLLATGDISHDGSEKSYQHWLECAEKLNKPILIIPGNHDDSFQLNSVFSIQACAGYYDTDSWRFILLDTRVANEDFGYLSETELTRLNNLLEEAENKNILIALHHHPLKIGSAWLDNIMLKNADDFFIQIRKAKNYNNIKSIICGHVHQDNLIMAEHIRFYSTPSSCIQFAKNSDEFGLENLAPGYRCMLLDSNGDFKTHIEYLDSVPDLNSSADYG